MTGTGPWSSPETVRAVVRRAWASGALLRGYASGEPFEPISVPLRGPTPGEAASDLARVQAWAGELERGARRAGATAYSLERRVLGGRSLGRNPVPCRAVVGSYDQAWRLLGTTSEVADFDFVLATTREVAPALVPWVCGHPLLSVSHAEAWPRLLSAVDWLGSRAGAGLYLRQIDAPGVDTKFVEEHRGVLADLLDASLPCALIDTRHSRGRTFALRYGFSMPEPLVRLRVGAGTLAVPAGVSELGLRVDELAGLPVPPSPVLVVENEVTYLSAPVTDGSLVIFGSGYTVAALGRLSWLADCEVRYWGDLDTHGLAILDRLRAWLPDVRSVLMDRATLLDHQDRWVSESSPTRSHLRHLTGPEYDLYQDLVEDTFGTAVRLEQERIDWTYALEGLGDRGR